MAEKRVSVSFRLPRSLVERARRIARDYAGKPTYLTIGKLVEAAITHELELYDDTEGDDPPTHRSRAKIGINNITITETRRR